MATSQCIAGYGLGMGMGYGKTCCEDAKAITNVTLQVPAYIEMSVVWERIAEVVN